MSFSRTGGVPSVATAGATAVGASPFAPYQEPVSGRTYARGTGGVTDLCTLYGFEPFNPCGTVIQDDCPNLLYIAIIIAILALLWIQSPAGSE
jgi:hypothetical protein